MAKKSQVSTNANDLYSLLPRSTFDGKLLGLIGTGILTFLAALLVIGIGAGIFCAVFFVVAPMLDGSPIELIVTVVGAIPLAFSIFLADAWGIVIVNRWIAKHSTVNGYRLKFTGKVWNFALMQIKWLFLSIITLTIYAWWIPIKAKKWQVENTVIDDKYFPKELLQYYQRPTNEQNYWPMDYYYSGYYYPCYYFY